MTAKQYREMVDASRFTHAREKIAGLDPEIQTIVNLLRSQGVETCQSCQGGTGHSYPDPTVDFVGTESAGWKALAIAIDFAMPVFELRRKWRIDHTMPTECLWQLVFVKSKLAAFNKSWVK